jgi:hypothetical protein
MPLLIQLSSPHHPHAKARTLRTFTVRVTQPAAVPDGASGDVPTRCHGNANTALLPAHKRPTDFHSQSGHLDSRYPETRSSRKNKQLYCYRCVMHSEHMSCRVTSLGLPAVKLSCTAGQRKDASYNEIIGSGAKYNSVQNKRWIGRACRKQGELERQGI